MAQAETRSTGATPEKLAQAPSNDVTHPAVMDRIVKDMRATAAVLDATHASSFAAEAPWGALQQLRSSVESLADEAELHRPDVDGVVWAAVS
jgi:hypothetical protein